MTIELFNPDPLTTTARKWRIERPKGTMVVDGSVFDHEGARVTIGRITLETADAEVEVIDLIEVKEAKEELKK